MTVVQSSGVSFHANTNAYRFSMARTKKEVTMRMRTAMSLVILGTLIASNTRAQVINSTTFNQGSGIVIANEMPDSTHAQLLEEEFIDEFSINIDTSENNEGLLRFDNLFGDGPGQIPLNHNILRAELRVRTYDTGDGGEFYRLLAPFDATTDTWNEWGNGIEPRNSDPSLQHDGAETVESFDFRVVGAFGGGDDDFPSVTRSNATESVRAWAESEEPNAANLGWHIDAFDSGGWGFWNFDHPEEGLRPELQVWHSETPATVLSFRQGQDGYAGAIDTVVKQSDPDANFGAELTLEADGSDNEGGVIYSLLRFEDLVGDAVGQIPANAQLVQATLSLSISSEGGDGIELRRIQSEWDQDSTWSSIADGAGVSLELSDGRATFHEIEQGARAELDVTGSVQAWLDGAENLGWLIAPLPGSTGDVHFDSSDSFDAEFAPSLELVFLPAAEVAAPEPSTLVLLTIAGLGLIIRFLRKRALLIALLVIPIATSGEAWAQLSTTTLTEGDAITISYSPDEENDLDADRTYADLIAAGNPGEGEMNIDTEDSDPEGFNRLLVGFLRFNEPLFGDGPGLVPLDGFIVDARLVLETTGEGDGAAFHRALAPFELDDTWNAWGNGLNGRNNEPGVQLDGVEAVAEPDLVTPDQPEGTSLLNVTNSVKAWQALGTVDAANQGVQNGWFLDAIGGGGWDFANFGNEDDPSPELLVTYSDVAPNIATFQHGFNGYEGATDTWISQTSPDESFGDGQGLSVATINEDGGQDISLIRFDDIIGDGPGQVPADSTLVRAVIKFDSQSSGSGVQARRMLTEWSEDTTWGEIIADGSMSLTPDSVRGSAPEGEFELDVTAGVQAYLDGADNYGWALSPLFEGTIPAGFESSDSGSAPLGDADGDSIVGLSDFNLLKATFGSDNSATDFDGNGTVDLSDFNILKSNFGQSGGPSAGRPTLEILYIPSDAAPVPEPTTIALAVVAIATGAGVSILRRGRNRRAC